MSEKVKGMGVLDTKCWQRRVLSLPAPNLLTIHTTTSVVALAIATPCLLNTTELNYHPSADTHTGIAAFALDTKGPSGNNLHIWAPADGRLRPISKRKILEIPEVFLRFFALKSTTANHHLTPNCASYFLTGPNDLNPFSSSL